MPAADKPSPPLRVQKHSPRLLFRESIADYAIRDALLRQAHHLHGRLLDLGCGDSRYQAYLRHRVDLWLGMDRPVPGHPAAQQVSLQGDALALPLAPESFDTVLCTQVLEHVPEPLDLLREAWRVLKPGGRLLLTAPQYNALHGEPQDYFRYTRYGLEHLARKADFTVESIEPIGGFISLFAFLTTIHLAPLRVQPFFGLWQWLAWQMEQILHRPKDCMGYLLVAVRNGASVRMGQMSGSDRTASGGLD